MRKTSTDHSNSCRVWTDLRKKDKRDAAFWGGRGASLNRTDEEEQWWAHGRETGSQENRPPWRDL